MREVLSANEDMVATPIFVDDVQRAAKVQHCEPRKVNLASCLHAVLHKITIESSNQKKRGFREMCEFPLRKHPAYDCVGEAWKTSPISPLSWVPFIGQDDPSPPIQVCGFYT